MFKTIEASLKAKDAVIISTKKYCHKGNGRLIIKAKKPKGRKVYTVVQYENGMFSSAV